MTMWTFIAITLFLSAGAATFMVLAPINLLNFFPLALAVSDDQSRASNQPSLDDNESDKVRGFKFESGSAPQHLAPSDSPGELDGLLPVKTFRLDTIQPAVLTQRYSGIVMSRRSSRLAAKHLGRIVRIAVDLGDEVKSGQVLAELDQRELLAEKGVLAAQLSGARARLEELERGPRVQEIEQAEAAVKQFEATLSLRRSNLRRTEDLVRTASVSKQEYDEASTSLDAAEAGLTSSRKALELLREGTRKEQIRSQQAVVQSLEAQLEKIQVLLSEQVITAPFDGHVQARLVDEGVVVSPGQAIVEVVETSHLEVHVGLPSQLISSGALSTAQVWCGQSLLPADLVRVSPTIDPRTRNVEVVYALQREPLQRPVTDSAFRYQAVPAECRVGQAVDVQLSVQSDGSGWWIPTSALVPASRGLWAVLVARPLSNESKSEYPDVASGSTLEVPLGQLEAAEQATVGPGQSNAVQSIVEMKQVELLRSSGDWSQVRGALLGSDQLVLSGVHRITNGQRICALSTPHSEVDLLNETQRTKNALPEPGLSIKNSSSESE